AQHSIDIIGLYQHALHTEGSMSVAYSESSKYPDADELAGVIEAHGIMQMDLLVRLVSCPRSTLARGDLVADTWQLLPASRCILDGSAGWTPHRVLTDSASRVILLFPKKEVTAEPRAWQTASVQGAAFRKYTAFIKAYKHLKLQGKQARKALLNRELGLAAEAAQRNVEEHRTIVRHFENLFQSNVAEQDLYDALRSTKYGKAVPSTSVKKKQRAGKKVPGNGWFNKRGGSRTG
ncbi:unnamed protein product, partial [Symbiodinium sp. CCMP2456]